MIQMITCGKESTVMPNGIRVSESTIRLTVIAEGAVIRDTRIGRSRDVQFTRNDPNLQLALDGIEMLVRRNPGYPRETPPECNEIIFSDGTVAYAPIQDLTALLDALIETKRLPYTTPTVSRPLYTPPAPAAEPVQIQSELHPDGTWDCKCGKKGLNTNYCFHCGNAKPQADVWFCPQCGAKCEHNFCAECGTARPVI